MVILMPSLQQALFDGEIDVDLREKYEPYKAG